MANFAKKDRPNPAISTASLPDIVFMLLFFFMVTTQLREVDLQILVKIPKASQLQKLEDKSLVSFIYVGKPKDQRKFGKEPIIQVNDVLINPDGITQFIAEEQAALGEKSKRMIVSVKADKDLKMGLLVDIKQKLRESEALRLNYASIQEEKN
jgi:biopolymer transport protein ExbD